MRGIVLFFALLVLLACSAHKESAPTAHRLELPHYDMLPGGRKDKPKEQGTQADFTSDETKDRSADEIAERNITDALNHAELAAQKAKELLDKKSNESKDGKLK